MPAAFHFTPDRFKTQEMCIRGVEIDPWALGFVPDRYKTQEMCIIGVEVDPSSF